MLQLGELELTTVCGGTYWIDGGTMFGVVPKLLWQRQYAPDESNRIFQRTSCLLVRSPDQTVLIDTGYGSKMTDKHRRQISGEEGEPLVRNLAAIGVAPEDIDAVIFTHLHFDHAGGASRMTAEGQLADVFPRAQYIVQRREWEIATSDLPELRGAYQPENLAPLLASGRLRFIEGDTEIFPGLRSVVTGGHTEAHQMIALHAGDQTAVYLADLVATVGHLRVSWCLGYDVHMIETRRAKQRCLGEIADNGWLALFNHDPEVAVARLARDSQKDFVVVDPRATC